MSRLHFSEACEAALNDQVNTELRASYAYMSMSAWCKQDGVALHGFAKYFRRMSGEERGHAQKLINYITMRGGKCIFAPIEPSQSDWQSALKLVEATLAMERDVTEKLYALHKLAGEHQDPFLESFLEDEFLQEQVEDVKEAADMVTRLKRAGTDGLGLYLFDRELDGKEEA